MYRRFASPLPRILKAMVAEKAATPLYRVEAQAQRHCSSSSSGLLRKSDGMSGESSDSITPTRVLFCGPHFPASHNYTIQYLQSFPFVKVDVLPFDEIPDAIGDYDICVVKSMRLNSDIIARANRMKLIMQFGVGIEGVDIDAATKHGIKVARIPSDYTGNATSCAEMAIYLMLGLLRKQIFPGPFVLRASRLRICLYGILLLLQVEVFLQFLLVGFIHLCLALPPLSSPSLLVSDTKFLDYYALCISE